MRADNRGEGGKLALLAPMVKAKRKGQSGLENFLIPLGLFGAALLYGDGMITPAISVLGAIEGIDVAAPNVSLLTLFLLTLGDSGYALHL